jgi:hypothetical protein
MIYVSIYFVAKNKGVSVRIPTLATSPHSCSFVICCKVSCDQFLFSDFCSFYQFVSCFSSPTLVACTLFDPLYRSSSSACRKVGPIQMLVLTTTLPGILRRRFVFISCLLSCCLLVLYQSIPYPLVDITITVFQRPKSDTVCGE